MISTLAIVVALGGGSQGEVLVGSAAFGGWRDDKPGVRRHIRAEDLPKPSAPTFGISEVVPRPEGALPQVPAGFKVELVTDAIKMPRVIRRAPNGDLFVANSMMNEVQVLRLKPGTATVEAREVFASGLTQPYGIAFHPPGASPNWVYVANSNGVVRFPYRNGDMKASRAPEEILANIPWEHHWTRDIAFSADGTRLFLAVGSASNVALDMAAEPRLSMVPEPHPVKGLEGWKEEKTLGATWDTEELRAAILSYDPEGRDLKVFATGLRNPSGITIRPSTGRLWAVINERDELGDDLPFEYATQVEEGKFYGWPWYYIGNNLDDRPPSKRPDLADQVTVPDVLMQAHSATLQIAFYQGSSFPAEYQGSAFVTMHGSWNRVPRTGYKVVRLLSDASGSPTGVYEDFMTGFVVSDEQVWGRPVGVEVGQDGSLFVTEDGNGTIWRVSQS